MHKWILIVLGLSACQPESMLATIYLENVAGRKTETIQIPATADYLVDIHRTIAGGAGGSPPVYIQVNDENERLFSFALQDAENLAKPVGLPDIATNIAVTNNSSDPARITLLFQIN